MDEQANPRETGITLDGVKGVGDSGRVEIALPIKEAGVYALIGVNGIGKTKTLESIFQVLFYSHVDYHGTARSPATHIVLDEGQVWGQSLALNKKNAVIGIGGHNKPVLFLGSQGRGFIQHKEDAAVIPIQDSSTRQAKYKQHVESWMKNGRFEQLNMDSNIEQWFVSRAQSSNRFQSKEDNREIEIETTLKILHQIEPDIDGVFLEVSGGGHVSLRIQGCKRRLSHLSSGFASIVRLVQAIVAGYGDLVNTRDLQSVAGIVLIDEIESHLHLVWQTRIGPLLKQLFPNTLFIVTTHSSLVLNQLVAGEAWRMYRDTDGIVKAREISNPIGGALVDLLCDAFDIDVNKLKLDPEIVIDQRAAKDELLQLLVGEKK